MAAAKGELKSSFVRTAEASLTELASAESEPWARDKGFVRNAEGSTEAVKPGTAAVLPLGYARVEFHNHAV